MEEHEGVVEEYQLDTITRTTRFLAGAAPKAATRISLGVALALDDAANDPAGELLGAKVVQGASGLSAAIGTIGRAAGAKAASTASSLTDAVRSGVDRLGASAAEIQKVPALNGAKEFVGQAVSELKSSWDAAGSVTVEVVAEGQTREVPLVEDARGSES